MRQVRPRAVPEAVWSVRLSRASGHVPVLATVSLSGETAWQSLEPPRSSLLGSHYDTKCRAYATPVRAPDAPVRFALRDVQRNRDRKRRLIGAVR